MISTFIELCNRSIQAGYLMIAIILLRMIWKRVPKLLYRYLWCLVGLRLALPFTWETALSLIPKKTVIKPSVLYSKTPSVDSGIQAVNEVVNPVITQSFTPEIGASVNPLQVIMTLGAWIWLIGLVALLLYGVISYIRLHYKVQDAVLLKENIFQSEKVGSPFVFGFLKPRIYLPYSLEEENLTYVIAHEKMHIKNRDHLLKPIAFILLSVYWFNPIVWLAYYLFCKDLELACDEWVIWNLETADKKAYAKALVMCSTERKFGSISPLAFGENAVKERIKNVLRYKNPSCWAFVGICVVVLIAVVCFMTNPVEVNENEIVLKNDGVIIDVLKEPEEIKSGSFEADTFITDGVENNWASENNQAVPILLKEPPKLGFSDMLSSKINQFQISANQYDWTYLDAELTEDGVYDFANASEVGISATGLEPTAAAKMTKWLRLTEYQGIDTWLYRLSCDVLPDKVVVKEYSIYDLGDVYADVRSEKVYTKDMLLIELVPGRIYEIVATWDRSHYEECGYYGEARYILVTDTEYATYDDIRKYQLEMANTVSVDAHIKEIYDGNTILISSDSDEFPGAFEVVIEEDVYDVSELYGGQNIRVEMYDSGLMNKNGKIPVYIAVSISNLIIEEPEDISLDEFVNMAGETYELNTLDGVTMQMEKYTSSGGEVEIRNETDKEITFGDWYVIQSEKSGKWETMPYKVKKVGFHQVAYNAPKDETVIHEVKWDIFYGELPKGRYRIIKDMLDFRGTGDYTEYYLAAEFEIR